MPKYSFVVDATIPMEITVEAESLEDAIELAKGSDTKELCRDCSAIEPGVWCAGDITDVDPARSTLTDTFVDGQTDIDAANAAEEMW